MVALRSQLRRAILVWFYCNPNSSVYVRQLAGILQVHSTNLSRELARLARRGFLRPYLQRNQLHYKIYRRHKETPVILNTLATLIATSPDWQRLLPGPTPECSKNRSKNPTPGMAAHSSPAVEA